MVTALTRARMEGKLNEDDARAARRLYLAEVAWTDAQLGRLVAATSPFRDRLTVLLADHGEALDEPTAAPYAHGEDVDLFAIRVPLVVAAEGAFQVPPATVIDRPVRLQDVATTLLALAGVEGGPVGDGEDLAALWGPAPPTGRPLFAEATKPLRHEAKDRWNNLPFERGVAKDGYYLVRSPWNGEEPTLYRISDGAAVADTAREAELLGILERWDANAPAFRAGEVDASMVEGLRALGYVH
jgi:arylsulfatase A-like enzyme